MGGFRPHSPYRRNLEDLEDGAIACRVVKPEENTEPDVATYARLAGSDFHNGIIEVDVRARLIHWADVDCRGC